MLNQTNSQYRLVLVTLGFLTILSLGAAAVTLMALSEPSSPTRSLKTRPSENSITIKSSITIKDEVAIPLTPLAQSAEFLQFSRQLHDISLSKEPQNPLERPIPYYLEEEDQNSIIYFYGEVDIRCWLELSNDKVLGKQCQLPNPSSQK